MFSKHEWNSNGLKSDLKNVSIAVLMSISIRLRKHHLQAQKLFFFFDKCEFFSEIVFPLGEFIRCAQFQNQWKRSSCFHLAVYGTL